MAQSISVTLTFRIRGRIHPSSVVWVTKYTQITRSIRIALGRDGVVDWSALCDGDDEDPDHVHDHAHPDDDGDDADSPSTGGLPMSLAIALFVAGIVLGVIPFSCS